MITNFRNNNATWRLIIVLFLGFTSGLPLALTAASLQTWLTVEKIDISTIGFFSLVGLPYTFKFLWAPLMDRFEPPFLGRRRGWLVITQIGLGFCLFLISQISPTENTQAFALIAALIAFVSASQDIVIDAYRTDILPNSERGLGSSLSVFGYRLAMIISSGVALMWADTISGKGWSWPYIYQVMAMIMLGSAVISLFFVPSVSHKNIAPTSNAKNDILGFLAVLVAVAIGYQFTTKLATPLAGQIMLPVFPDAADGTVNVLRGKWADLLSLFLGVAFTLPLAWWASQKAKFETLNTSLKNYFSMKSAGQFLLFIILYKLGDAFAGSLATPFLLKGAGYAQAEIGVVNKVIGMWLTIIGAILGGALMTRLGMFRSLLYFGILQLASNFGFWAVAVLGKGALGGFELPAFDILLVTLKEATNVDWLLLTVVGFENITGGMGTAAFVAFLMALCNQKFTATQYALLSAFAAIGRVWVGPSSGVLSEQLGWPTFFIFSAVMAVPGLFMLMKMKKSMLDLEKPEGISLLDD